MTRSTVRPTSLTDSRGSLSPSRWKLTVRLELGVVYNPYVGELYFAERGAGAFLNDRRLQVSTIDTLERALLATGFAYDHKQCKANNYDQFHPVPEGGPGVPTARGCQPRPGQRGGRTF